MSATYTVFYAGLLWGQYPVNSWPGPSEFPDGVFLYMNMNGWYRKECGAFLTIKREDVPKELLLNLLLLNL